jgi:hypothetical protein
LDHYLGCRRRGFEIQCQFSEGYQAHLQSQKGQRLDIPALSLRRRLLRTV